MERPWSYYLLLVIAWLAGLWGLFQIADAWVTWPTIDAAAARDVARAKLWLAGGLIFGAAALGGLATLIRLVQDGFAQLAARPGTARAWSAAEPAAAMPVERRIEPQAAAASPATGDPKIAAPKIAAGVERKPEPAPRPEPKREVRIEPAIRLSGDAAAAQREPRLERPRLSETARDEPAPGERREPKFLPDA